MRTTQSDYAADNSLECPRCGVPIEEQRLTLVEPGAGWIGIDCPHCSMEIIVSLQIVNLYTAIGA